jgi:hypothetical protein
VAQVVEVDRRDARVVQCLDPESTEVAVTKQPALRPTEDPGIGGRLTDLSRCHCMSGAIAIGIATRRRPASVQHKQAVAETDPVRTVAGPKGEISAAAFLRFRLVDLVVHAWDFLRGARLEETLDPRVVAELVEVVEPHLGEMLAYGAYGAYGPGPSGTLPTDASLQGRLLDWFGRRPQATQNARMPIAIWRC